MMKLTPELARIHAHICGDGCLCQYKTSEKDRINRCTISYCNNNLGLLQSFRKDMTKTFGVKMSFKRKSNEMRVASIRIGKDLLNLSKYGSREWRIPLIIKNSSRKIKMEWIKAFSFDEGCLPKGRNYIRIKSVNFLGLKDMQEMLNKLRIKNNITGPNCDNTWYINIKKEKELFSFTKKPSRK